MKFPKYIIVSGKRYMVQGFTKEDVGDWIRVVISPAPLKRKRKPVRWSGSHCI